MRPAPALSWPLTGNGPSLRSRAASFGLAVGINLLLILALLSFAAQREFAPTTGEPITITLIPNSGEVPALPQPAPRKKAAAAKSEPRARPPVPKVPPPIPVKTPESLIVLTREEFAAADISKLAPPGPASPGTQQASNAPGDSERVGTAPNGQPLYGAEWYRRPTHAQLSTYLPPGMAGAGWGLIACRTAPRYRVEDCVELADSPPGSRLAGAVRQAAWQFLVRPPRVGGKEMVGTWVRIRIDYTSQARN